jgi:DNA-binding transcriptional regulator YhcF (GntR family)
MFFAVDPGNGIAIYEQIVRQVKFAVAGGALRAGERVPSVRDLARELAINPNTVARAYRQLQADGVLASLRGTGLEVSLGAGDPCRTQRLELVGTRLRQVLVEARQSGLNAQELRKLVERELTAIERMGE